MVCVTVAVVIASLATAGVASPIKNQSSGGLTLGGTCGKPATGKPYHVYQMTELSAIPASGVDGQIAAVKAINACGGIKGRPIDAIVCEGVGDQSKGLACANKAVDDPDAIGVAGSSQSAGDVTDPIYEKANMSVNGLIGPGADASSPIYFGTNVGNLISEADGAFAAKVLKKKQLGLPYLNFGNFGTAAVELMNQLVIKPNKLPALKTAPIDLSEANYPAKIAALGDVDAVVPALLPAQVYTITNEARKAGMTYPFVLNNSIVAPVDLQKEVTNPDPFYVLSGYKLSGPGYKQYQRELDAIGKKGTTSDGGNVIQAWLGFHMFADVANSVGPSVDRKSMLSAMTKLSSYDTKGLTPVLDFTKRGQSKTFPNIINWGVVYYKYTDGKFVPTDGEKFHFDLLPKK